MLPLCARPSPESLTPNGVPGARPPGGPRSPRGSTRQTDPNRGGGGQGGPEGEAAEREGRSPRVAEGTVDPGQREATEASGADDEPRRHAARGARALAGQGHHQREDEAER